VALSRISLSLNPGYYRCVMHGSASMDFFDRAIARAKRLRATQPVAVAAQYDAAHD